MIRAILLIVLAACATTHHAEQTTETAKTLDKTATAQVEKDSEKQTQAQVNKRVEEGARWEADFTFAPLPPAPLKATAPAPGAVEPASSAAPAGAAPASPDGLPPHGELLKLHLSGQGPTITELQALAASQAKGHQEADSASATHEVDKSKGKGTTDSSFKLSGILGGLLALWPVWLLALLAGAGVLAWRLLKAKVEKLPIP